MKVHSRVRPRSAAASTAASAALLVLTLLAAACGSSGGAPSTKPTPKPTPSASGGAGTTAAAQPAAQPASGTPSVGASSSTTPAHLTAAWSVISTSQLPLWVAAAGGYFAKHGLDVNVVKAGAGGVGLAALVGGKVNALETTASSTMTAASGGYPVVYLGAVLDKLVQVMMVRSNSPIKSLADMRGKKVGVTKPGSLSDSADNLAAHEAGLVPGKDFQILRFNDIPTIESALQNGAIDIAFLDSPSSYEGEKQAHLKVVLNLASLTIPYSEVGFTMSRPFVTQHPAEVKAFEAAIGDAVARMKADPAFAEQVLEHYSGIKDTAVLQQSVQSVIPYLSTTFIIDHQGLENARLFASYGVPKLKTFNVNSILPPASVRQQS